MVKYRNYFLYCVVQNTTNEILSKHLSIWTISTSVINSNQMSRCKYCGEYSGFSSKYHKECHEIKSNAWQNLLNKIETTIVKGRDLGALKSKIISVSKSSYIDSSEIQTLLAMGFNNAVRRFLEDGVLSKQEEEYATSFKSHFNLSRLDLNYNDAFNTMVKASVLRDVLNGTFTDGLVHIELTSPFNFQDEEKLIWLFKDVEYYESRNGAQHRGGSSGLYIKLDNGVYFRKSSFTGRILNTDEMVFRDTGSVGITTGHIYFIGETYFSIEYNEIMTSYGHEDGLGIKKTGAVNLSHVFKKVDGWFCYNLLANLTQK